MGGCLKRLHKWIADWVMGGYVALSSAKVELRAWNRPRDMMLLHCIRVTQLC